MKNKFSHGFHRMVHFLVRPRINAVYFSRYEYMSESEKISFKATAHGIAVYTVNEAMFVYPWHRIAYYSMSNSLLGRKDSAYHETKQKPKGVDCNENQSKKSGY